MSNLDECFKNFYQNNYPIIVIEDHNTGGQLKFAVALIKYIQPRISKPFVTSGKATNAIKEQIFSSGQNLDPETCIPYTEKDDILNGEQEIYSNGVIHHRTRNFDSSDILEKLQFEILTQKKNIRKPTEIIVFTDGYSFSCGSVLIKRLQKYGTAIIVGYNSRLNDQTKFDASQSNSQVSDFENHKNVKNLADLGYNMQMAYIEEFNPNNNNENEVPEEFLIYPVDEMSKIYKPYKDEIYDRFIKEGKDIIAKYNKIEGECNPDNKYLYFETDKCDNIIEKGHGGYLCGTDGKWNTSNCIISYCDEGYILSDNRTHCLENPCLNIGYKQIDINDENYKEMIIQPKTIYQLSFQNRNNKYSLSSETEGIYYQSMFFITISPLKNNSIVGAENLIFINYYLNLTKNTTIYIKKIGNTTENGTDQIYQTDQTEQTDQKDQTDQTDQTDQINEFRNSNSIKKKKSVTAWKIVLIVLGSVIALLIFGITFFLSMKKNPQVILPQQNETIREMQI